MPALVDDAPLIHWEPQEGPQEALLACSIEDVGYGGARGGGKTDGALGDFLSHADQYGALASGVFFRKSYPELQEVQKRARDLFEGTLAVWKAGEREWRFHNGAVLKMRYLDRDSHADKYRGHQYTWICFEDCGDFASPVALDKLRACLRQAKGKVQKRFLNTFNPGGPGHNWLKARYIDPAPPYTPFYDKEMRTWRVFIPALLEDNRKLLENDPEYLDKIYAATAGNAALFKAWRYGQWDIVAGGMFDDVWDGNTHVIRPFPIPATWRVDRSFDWGSSHPFSVGWWAESDGTQAPNGRTYPRGTLFRIAEWYGWNGKPNQGLKMLATDIAKRVVSIEALMLERRFIQTPVKPGPADTGIFDVVNGMCLAADMAAHKVRWTKADKSPGSRKTGAEKLRSRLMASRQFPMEDPGIFIFNTNRNWIRTVPVLPRDMKDPDDVDTKAEDHPYDETRYRLLEKVVTVTAQQLVGF